MGLHPTSVQPQWEQQLDIVFEEFFTSPILPLVK